MGARRRVRGGSGGLTELDSKTSPATGAYTSEAALTDSTEPNESPLLYFAPGEGKST